MLAVSRVVEKKAVLTCAMAKYEKTARVVLLILAGQLLVQCSKVSKHLHQATSFRRSLQTRLSCNTVGQEVRGAKSLVHWEARRGGRHSRQMKKQVVQE